MQRKPVRRSAYLSNMRAHGAACIGSSGAVRHYPIETGPPPRAPVRGEPPGARNPPCDTRSTHSAIRARRAGKSTVTISVFDASYRNLRLLLPGRTRYRFQSLEAGEHFPGGRHGSERRR